MIMPPQGSCYSRVQISLIFEIFGFWSIFGFLDPKWAQKGPGGLPKGPGIDSASFGPSFSPNGPILGPMGPLFIFQFPKNPFWAQIAPSPTWVQGHLGPGPHPIWVLGPMEAEGRLFGGVWGGGAPPLQRGGSGGAAAPPEKNGPWSYCQ